MHRGTGIELIHVVHSVIAAPSYGQVQALDQTLLAVGRSVLTDAADRMRPRLRDKVPLSTELLIGPVAATIADRAGSRDLVVLERRAPQRLDRLLTMSISTRVAAHAAVAVVVVPPDWVPANGALPVTVGIDRADPVGQVEAAAAYAATHDLDLTVLFAMWLAEPYQDTVFVNHTRRQWTREAETGLLLGLKKLDLDGTRLKPNMVLPGTDARDPECDDVIAERTLAVLRDCVPAAVPGIVFLSGGQSEQQATARLDALNRRTPQPWKLSFSFGRALQAPVLRAWKGDGGRRDLAQRALLERAALNGAARYGT
ncbi:class I fructose-bisphosphate aldolase [Nocardioides pyridinolyticus]